MKINLTKKIICVVVALAFSINELCYGLAPMPGSTQPQTKGAMYAGGQKLFAAKIGPGAIDFDAYRARYFIGDEILQLPEIEKYSTRDANGHNARFVEANYELLPKGWGKSESGILKETDLISAFKVFAKKEAMIEEKNLDIVEGYFPVDEESGELPICRIERISNDRYALVIHTKFVQMWNHIRKNDVWFEVGFGQDDVRTVSVAWGIFYRIAKHEFTDLKSISPHSPKSMGHMSAHSWGHMYLVDDEIKANTIDGNYWLLNDSIWLWFLASYSFGDTTRYDNETFLKRINWIFDDKEAQKLNLHEEFPRLLNDRGIERAFATSLAYRINYNFFNRPRGFKRPRITVPRATVSEGLIDKYKERENMRKAAGITEEPTYATGLERTPPMVKGVTAENVDAGVLTKTVIAAIMNDIATTPKEKEKIIKLWGDFIEKYVAANTIVDMAGIKEALAGKEQGARWTKYIFVILGTISAISGILYLDSAYKWADIMRRVREIGIPTAEYTNYNLGSAVLYLATAAAFFILYTIPQRREQKNFARLAVYLEKFEKAQNTPVAGDADIKPDDLAQTVITVIQNDSGLEALHKEKLIAHWNDFVKKHLTSNIPLNIAYFKNELKLKFITDKIEQKIYPSEALQRMALWIAAEFASLLFDAPGWIMAICAVFALKNLFHYSKLKEVDRERQKELAALTGYIDKSMEELANQTVSTPEEEQTPVIVAKKSTQEVPEPIASLTDEMTAPVTQPIIEEHPLIKLISEYIVKIGFDKGPGAETLSPTEFENIYKTINLLREDNIEILIPQQMKLTEDMRKAIKDMGKREGGSHVVCRQYAHLPALAQLLKLPPAGKRIVITDIVEEYDRELMAQMVTGHPEYFAATRLLNIALPANYSKMDKTEKTVYQAKIVTIAILARLFEKDKTPMVEMLLRSMIKDCLDLDDKGMNEYFNELGNPDDGKGLSPEALVKRILFLIGKTIKVAERIGEEIRLMKAFWTAA